MVLVLERRLGRPGLMVRLSLMALAVQAVTGLLAHSTTVYLAQPLLVSGAWAVGFLGSAAIGRPLAGVLDSSTSDQRTGAARAFPLSVGRSAGAQSPCRGPDGQAWGRRAQRGALTG